MNLDPLEAEVLGWLLDEPDTLRTLAENFPREFGSSATEASISSALGRLADMGIVQAYQFDEASNSYQPVAWKNPPLTAWFQVSRAGRELVDRLP